MKTRLTTSLNGTLPGWGHQGCGALHEDGNSVEVMLASCHVQVQQLELWESVADVSPRFERQ
jgi:hypothetical protein